MCVSEGKEDKIEIRSIDLNLGGNNLGFKNPDSDSETHPKFHVFISFSCFSGAVFLRFWGNQGIQDGG